MLLLSVAAVYFRKWLGLQAVKRVTQGKINASDKASLLSHNYMCPTPNGANKHKYPFSRNTSPISTDDAGLC